MIDRLERDVAEVAAPIPAHAPSPHGHDPQKLPHGISHAAPTGADDLSEAFFQRRRRGAPADPVEFRIRIRRPAAGDAAGTSHRRHRRLEQAALERNSAQFIGHLHRLLGLSREQTRRIVEDPSGEPIVVAAKALSMPTEILQRVLLFLNPAIGHSVSRVFDLSHLFAEITRRPPDIWSRSGAERGRRRVGRQRTSPCIGTTKRVIGVRPPRRRAGPPIRQADATTFCFAAESSFG